MVIDVHGYFAPDGALGYEIGDPVPDRRHPPARRRRGLRRRHPTRPPGRRHRDRLRRPGRHLRRLRHPATAAAVEATITAVGPAGNGYARAWPAGTALPNATFLNFTAGESIGNTGTIPIATTAATADLTVRVLRRHPRRHRRPRLLRPRRHPHLHLRHPLPDRRHPPTGAGGAFAAGQARDLQVAGTGAGFAAQGGTAGGCAIPDDAVAVEATITAVGPAGAGFARACPAGTPLPNATFLNFSAGESIGNTGTSPSPPTATTADLALQAFGAGTHVVIDIAGHHTPDRSPTSTDITAGGTHTCALLDADRTVRCWGCNADGQLGNGTTTGSDVPVAVTGLDGVVSTSPPARTTPAPSLADGTARCWGDNDYGQLGDGTTTDSTTPVAVTGLTDAAAITAGASHTCAPSHRRHRPLLGRQPLGQLGDGTTTNSTIPVTVTGLTDATTSPPASSTPAPRAPTAPPAAGATTSTASSATAPPPTPPPPSPSPAHQRHHHHRRRRPHLRHRAPTAPPAAGATTTTASSATAPPPTPPPPSTVTGLTGATAITAGGLHTCATPHRRHRPLLGLNAAGQLGDGTTTDSTTPVTVTGLDDATTITAGTVHSCAIRTDGTARCWGDNTPRAARRRHHRRLARPCRSSSSAPEHRPSASAPPGGGGSPPARAKPGAPRPTAPPTALSGRRPRAGRGPVENGWLTVVRDRGGHDPSAA